MTPRKHTETVGFRSRKISSALGRVLNPKRN